MIIDFNFILVLGILFAIGVAFLLYHSTSHWTFKSFVLILALTIGTAATSYYYQQLGAPIHGIPSEEFMYIHHVILPSSDILMWVRSENGDDRLYKFEYDRETAEKAAQAQQAIQQGQMITGEFTEDNTGKSSVHFSEGSFDGHGGSVGKPAS